MASLKERILDDVKSTMKAREKRLLGALRQVQAAIQQVEVDTRSELDDAAVLAVLDKMVKQRRESISQYGDAGRADLVDQEEFEIGVIEKYLPQPLTETEIEGLISAAIAEVGATSMKEMGQVMKILKPQIAGRGDVGAVSAKVKDRLG